MLQQVDIYYKWVDRQFHPIQFFDVDLSKRDGLSAAITQ